MDVGKVRRLAWQGIGPWLIGVWVLACLPALIGCQKRCTITPESGTPESATAKSETATRRVDSVLRDTGGQTDNSACMVCHMDFADEPMAAKHLDAKIVCASCHGRSEAHGGDESNITTPDVTFGRAEIGPFCKTCHPKHKTGKEYDVFIKKWRGKRRPNGRMVLDNSVCTDCDGNHAILTPG